MTLSQCHFHVAVSLSWVLPNMPRCLRCDSLQHEPWLWIPVFVVAQTVKRGSEGQSCARVWRGVRSESSRRAAGTAAARHSPHSPDGVGVSSSSNDVVTKSCTECHRARRLAQRVKQCILTTSRLNMSELEFGTRLDRTRHRGHQRHERRSAWFAQARSGCTTAYTNMDGQQHARACLLQAI